MDYFFYSTLDMVVPLRVNLWGQSLRQRILWQIFLITLKRASITLICDHTDKRNTSFESVKGLLLFIYTHNNNTTLYF